MDGVQPLRSILVALSKPEITKHRAGGTVRTALPCRSASSTSACRSRRPVEIAGSTDDREVGEGLREIAEKSTLSDIILFRQQADIVPQPEQALEQGTPLVHTALQDQVVRQPERASDKCYFARWQRVIADAGVVPMDEAIAHQMSFYRLHGAQHAWIAGRQRIDPTCRNRRRRLAPRPIVADSDGLTR